MSHVKNVQAFGKLTGICTGYGGSYKPGKQHLQVNALATLSKCTQHVMKKVDEAQSHYDFSVSQRNQGFEDLGKISGAVVQLMRANGTDPYTLAYASAHNRKIKRIRNGKSKPSVGEGEAVLVPSTSHGNGIPHKVQYFSRLVELVEKDPNYETSETALTVEGLREKLTQLKALIEVVVAAEVQLTEARRNRDALLYESKSGLFATATAVKQYVRAVFGYQSPQHQELVQLTFTKPYA